MPRSCRCTIASSPGAGWEPVVAEAVGERAVVAIRPAGAEQDDLARLELAVLGLPRPDEVGA